MLKKYIVFLLVAAVPAAWTTPLSVLQGDHPPLAAELSSRAAARAAHLAQDSGGDPRFPLPTAQELAAIRKVAETLIMLGQEVIPSIIGEAPIDLIGSSTLAADIPNDPVNND